MDAICARLRRGEGLTAVAMDAVMPCRDTMMNWLNSDRFGFRRQYLEAKRIAAFLLAEQLMDEARDDRYDNFMDEHGVRRPNHARVQRSRLICDAIKWQVGKMLPKVYGEHVTQEHEVSGDLAELLRRASNQTRGLPAPIADDDVRSTRQPGIEHVD